MKEIQNLIENAVQGELDTRIDASSYEGFMKGLGDGIFILLFRGFLFRGRFFPTGTNP